MLIQAWSETELDKNQGRAVINYLKNANLHQKHGREATHMLYDLVRDGGMPCALELLPQANKIAAALWTNIDRDQSRYEISNELSPPAQTLAPKNTTVT